MRINTNVSSITAQEAATNTGKKIANSLEKLSTGLRINKASDDASGLAIADKLRTQGTSIDQGVSNGNSAVTLLQIADKSMAEQSNILDTVKAKLIQANTDTTSDDGREAIRKDINKLLEQLDNIAEQTNYNGNVLLQSTASDKSGSADLNFQIGESKNDIINNSTIQSNTDGLGGGTEALTSGTKLESGVTTEINKGTFELASSTSGSTATTGKGEKFELTGKVGALSVTSGTVKLSNLDADTAALLQAEVDKGTTGISVSAGVFTLTTGASINGSFDFGDHNVTKMTVETSVATGGVNLTTTGSVRVKDLDATAGEDLTVRGTGATGGEMLSSLADVKEGELTKELADKFQGVVDNAITDLNSYRGDIGSTQNQVESAVRNLMTQSTNVKAAESIIRDVDYAAESANFNKQNIISQAGSYAISQANQVQQNVLKLLQ